MPILGNLKWGDVFARGLANLLTRFEVLTLNAQRQAAPSSVSVKGGHDPQIQGVMSDEAPVAWLSEVAPPTKWSAAAFAVPSQLEQVVCQMSTNSPQSLLMCHLQAC